ncbi:hypothetical protein BKA67DRAFT_578350 [Truncatella angustata]|uniref:Uncharacterized protein n=1 Tax=Truncatella angustata TaxID=152316 RepID=A0A9P8UAT4_9PEZI|nr:uncharacterized protein BKA67DRAFT_578350 [Truncatella angustata]KAH6647706.1 hypothetical protein BKA67DRAFT_578350 [Truncatella angustata]
MVDWPCQRQVDLHFDPSMREESCKWLESFDALQSKTLKAFNKGKFDLLAALAHSEVPDGRYSIRSRRRLRTIA